MAQVNMASGHGAEWNRFAHLPRPMATMLLLLLAVLMAVSVAGSITPTQIKKAGKQDLQAEGMIGDHALYANIVKRVQAGEPYYRGAADEQRRNNYPVRPFMTIRLPTLAHIMAAIGTNISVVLATILAGVVMLAWKRRLDKESGVPFYVPVCAALLMVANLSQVRAAHWVLVHETVTGVLIALALVLYRPARPWATMAVLAVTLTIRESALPVAMLLGVFALLDRNWRAVAGWLALGFGFLGLMAVHASYAEAVTLANDPVSQGWQGQYKWATYIAFVHETSILRLFPTWVTAMLVPLTLFGFSAWRGRLGLVMILVQLGYAALIMAFARPDNYNWALLIVPSLFIGLAFVPAVLMALTKSALRGPDHASDGVEKAHSPMA